jgi:ribosomal protein S12 methylthiotransferase accessory factor
MPLEITYLNERIELFDGMYGGDRQSEHAAVSRLYNRRIGPIRSLHLERPDLTDFSMYTGSCTHSPVHLLLPDFTVRPVTTDAMLIPGGGKGIGAGPPLFGALGELAERLLSVLHFAAAVDDLESATYADLCRDGRRALGPDELHLFAPEQYTQPGFGYVPFRETSPLRWIQGTDLVTGDAVWVPAQLALLYYKRGPHEPPIGYPTSGGLAFHTNRDRAILHGICEYIERDAINVRWYSRLAPPRVLVDVSALARSTWGLDHARFMAPGLDPLCVYLNTLDVPIPVFTAITIDRTRQRYSFVGAGGAWADRDRALVQTVFELAQTRAVLNSCASGTDQIAADSAPQQMRQFLDGALYFGHAANLPRLEWYLSGGGTISWDAIKGPTSFDRSWLTANGLRPIVIDLDGACWPGIHVIRVLVPQLTAACVAAHPYLGHPRYYDTPCRVGARQLPLRFDELNTDPIPFP